MRILIFDISSVSNGMAASGVLGQTNFTDSGVGTTQSKLFFPTDIEYDSINERLFVADRINSRILIMNLDLDNYTNGQNFDYVLGAVNFTTYIGCGVVTASSLCNPRGIEYNPITEELFVADTDNNRVLIYDASVAALSNGDAAINILGQNLFTTNSAHSGLGSNSAKGFLAPYAIEIDVTNELAFISDNQKRIYIFDISTLSDFEDAVNIIGQNNFSTHDCGTTIDAGTLCEVHGIVYSEVGQTLYVADYVRRRVLGYDVSTITDGENATQLIGQQDYNSGYLNYLSVPNAEGMHYPSDASIDYINNRLFVNDGFGTRILVYNLNENGDLADKVPDYVLGADDFVTYDDSCQILEANSLCYPYGMDIDVEGQRLFVADSSWKRVLVFDINPSNMSNNMDADYVLGQDNFTSADCITDSATKMCSPGAVAFDSTNNYLYVSSYSANRVIGFDLSDGITNGMAATRVIGQDNFTDTDANKNATIERDTLDGPISLGMDNEGGYLYIADANQHRIMIHDISDDTFVNGQDATYVLGQVDFVSDDYTCGGVSTICDPIGFAIDEENDLTYIADFGSNRVLVFDTTELENGMNATAVLGQDNFTDTGDNQGEDNPNNNSLSQMSNIAVNKENGDLFIPDSANNRVLQYKFARLTQTSLSNGESGEVYSQDLTVVNDQGTATIALQSGTLPPGLTLNANSITGTPTTSGSYTFTLQVEDDNGDNGIFGQKSEFTILVDEELIDTDDDGITDVIENSGPNDGDSNNDNTLDSEQLNVTTFVNEVTDNYVTLHTSTSCNEITATDIITTDTDNAFDYPLGLLSFTALCDNPGDSVTVTEYFYDDLDITLLTPRKYNPNTQEYQTITEYTLEEETIGGESAIVLTFDIVDGGALDTDGLVNSVIIDPSGLAENSVGTPDTGLGGSRYKL